MTQQHITPPTEMLQRWMDLPLIQEERLAVAYRSGADAELEACIEELYRLWDKDHIVTLDDVLKHLRSARRPKPPSLKDQALEELDAAILRGDCFSTSPAKDIIRRALKSIPDPS